MIKIEAVNKPKLYNQKDLSKLLQTHQPAIRRMLDNKIIEADYVSPSNKPRFSEQRIREILAQFNFKVIEETEVTTDVSDLVCEELNVISTSEVITETGN